MLALNGSSYAEVSISAVQLGGNYTLACVASHANTTSPACAWNLSRNTNNGSGVQTGALFLRGDLVGDPAQMRHVFQFTTPTTVQVNSSGAYSANTLYTLVGSIDAGSANHRIFVDGMKTTLTTPTTVSLGSVDVATIGELLNLGAQDNSKLNGNVARCAWWNVSLTDREAQAFAKGAPVTSIRPQSLVMYFPLRNSLNSQRSRTALTNHGTTFAARHCRSYFGA
jgi:hypothetical protein